MSVANQSAMSPVPISPYRTVLPPSPVLLFCGYLGVITIDERTIFARHSMASSTEAPCQLIADRSSTSNRAAARPAVARAQLVLLNSPSNRTITPQPAMIHQQK